MSKYIDSFADATVDTGSMTGTMAAPQAEVGTKKKVKIDASLLLNLDVSTALLTRPQGLRMQEPTGQTCTTTQQEGTEPTGQTCHTTQQEGTGQTCHTTQQEGTGQTCHTTQQEGTGQTCTTTHPA